MTPTSNYFRQDHGFTPAPEFHGFTKRETQRETQIEASSLKRSSSADSIFNQKTQPSNSRLGSPDGRVNKKIVFSTSPQNQSLLSMPETPHHRALTKSTVMEPAEKDFQSSLSNAQQKLVEQALLELTNGTSETQDTTTKFRKLIASYQYDVDQLNKKIEELEEDIQSCSETNEGLYQENTKLDSNNLTLISNNLTLISNNEELTRINKTLSGANEELTRINKTLSGANEELTGVNKTISEMVLENNDYNRTLREEQQENEKKIKKLEKQIYTSNMKNVLPPKTKSSFKPTVMAVTLVGIAYLLPHTPLLFSVFREESSDQTSCFTSFSDAFGCVANTF